MYVLLYYSPKPQIFRRYTTRKGALIGMRAANRRCGWTKISMCRVGAIEVEWCARSNGLPEYNYAPFAIANEAEFKRCISPPETVDASL